MFICLLYRATTKTVNQTLLQLKKNLVPRYKSFLPRRMSWETRVFFLMSFVVLDCKKHIELYLRGFSLNLKNR